MKYDFIRCGMCGWCMEVLWTGLHAFLKHDPKLTGVSSLFMFPIYGMAAVIGPVSQKLQEWPRPARGVVYMLGIYAVEFTSGIYLKSLGCCPWDYSGAPLQIAGVIRLDYAPLWYCAGLFYERLLAQRG